MCTEYKITTAFFQRDLSWFAVGAGDVLLDGGKHSLCVGKSGHVLRGHVYYVQQRPVPPVTAGIRFYR